MKVYIEIDINENEINEASNKINGLKQHCKTMFINTESTKIMSAPEKPQNPWIANDDQLDKQLKQVEKDVILKVTEPIVTEFLDMIINPQYNPNYSYTFVQNHVERFCRKTERYQCSTTLISSLYKILANKKSKIQFPNIFTLPSQTLAILFNLKQIKENNFTCFIYQLFDSAKEKDDILAPMTLLYYLSTISISEFSNRKVFQYHPKILETDETMKNLKKEIENNITVFLNSKKMNQ